MWISATKEGVQQMDTPKSNWDIQAMIVRAVNDNLIQYPKPCADVDRLAAACAALDEMGV